MEPMRQQAKTWTSDSPPQTSESSAAACGSSSGVDTRVL